MKIQKSKTLVCLAAIAILASLVSVVGARYIKSLEAREGVFVAATYYFRSNVMTEDSAPATITVNGTATTVDLANGINSSEHANVPIHYVLNYYVHKDGDWVLAQRTENQTFEKTGFTVENLTLTPIVYEAVTYNTIMVEAVSTSPFQKTLRARISFQYEHSKVSYSYDAESNVITATLATNVDDGTFLISWSAGVSPDNADENGILNTASIGPASVSPVLDAQHIYILKFFINDPSLENEIETAVDPNAVLADIVSVTKQ